MKETSMRRHVEKRKPGEDKTDVKQCEQDEALKVDAVRRRPSLMGSNTKLVVQTW